MVAKKSGRKRNKSIGNREKVRREFNEFARKISKLESLKSELDSLDTRGFESEDKIIRSKLKNVNAIPQIEKELNTLKVKVGGASRSVQRSVVRPDPNLKRRIRELEGIIKRKKRVSVKKQLSKDEVRFVKDIPNMESKLMKLRKDFESHSKPGRVKFDTGVGILVDSKYDDFIQSIKGELSKRLREKEKMLGSKMKAKEKSLSSKLNEEFKIEEKELAGRYKDLVRELHERYKKRVSSELGKEVKLHFSNMLERKLNEEKMRFVSSLLNENARKLSEEKKKVVKDLHDHYIKKEELLRKKVMRELHGKEEKLLKEASELEEKTKKAVRDAEEGVKRARSAASKSVALARAQSNKSIALARAQSNKSISSVKSDSEKRIASARAQSNKSISSVKSDSEKRIASARAQSNKSIALARAQSNKSVSSVKSDAEKKIKAHISREKILSDRWNSARKEFEERRAKERGDLQRRLGEVGKSKEKVMRLRKRTLERESRLKKRLGDEERKIKELARQQIKEKEEEFAKKAEKEIEDAERILGMKVGEAREAKDMAQDLKRKLIKRESILERKLEEEKRKIKESASAQIALKAEKIKLRNRERIKNAIKRKEIQLRARLNAEYEAKLKIARDKQNADMQKKKLELEKHVMQHAKNLFG